MNYRMLTCLNAADPMPMKFGTPIRMKPLSAKELERVKREHAIQAFEQMDHSHLAPQFTVTEGSRRTFSGGTSELQNIPKTAWAVSWDDCLSIYSRLIQKLGTGPYLTWLEEFKRAHNFGSVQSSLPRTWGPFVSAAEAKLKELSA